MNGKSLTSERQKQQQTLLELSRTINESSGSLQPFWESLTRLAADNFDADMISIWTVVHDDDGDINHCICEYDTAERQHTDLSKTSYDYLLSSYPAYMSALKEERILAIDDCRNDPRSIELSEQFFIPYDTYSMLDAMIRTQNCYVGHISIEHSHKIHHWTENEIAFAAALADQASIAILENQRTLLNKEIEQQLQRVQRQQAAIAELSRSQTTISGDLGKTASQLCQLVATVLNSQIVNVYLRKAGDIYESDYGLDISCDGKPNPLEHQAYAVSEYPIFFDALSRQDILVIDDDYNDYRVQEFVDEYTLLGAKSELTAAIRIRGEMAGFICCEKTDDYYQWETDEVSFISNIADIFSAAYLNNELRLAKLDAEQATRQKSIFLANMSHEIRTPMNGILGITEIMQGTQLTAQQRTYLNNINTSGESLLSLINDIIDLSKIETGALTIEHIDFELSKIINDAALLFKINRDKELQFDIIIDDKLPAFIHSDPYRIKQVLINLLGNAFKFTNEGSVRLECALEKSNAPAVTIRFTVTDTGIGFDPKKSDYIFDSFTQASTPATKDYGGSGLGLNISKNLVQLLGGTIGCHSTPGVGSEFWFTIEACAAKNPALTFRPELPAVIPSSTIFNPQDYRLLVAEDNEVNSMVTTTMLKAMGFNYSLVENGQKAVEAIKDEHFDAILMDCQMPVMDGFEATRIIRKLETEGASTKIIALTANAMDGEESRCREAGMDNYLSKPFKSAELFQLLRNELTSNSSYGI